MMKRHRLPKEVYKITYEQEKEVFTLLIAGLSYSEIAKNLDKNLKQIDNTIQRIKTKVKRIIDNTHS